MAKTVLTFTEEAGKGFVSSFVSVIGRTHIQISKNYKGDGVTYVEASTDGDTFAGIVSPMSGRDLLIPIEVPNGVTVRVVSTDAVSYAAVLSDEEVQPPIPDVDPTQMYFKNAISDYDGNWYDAVIIGDQVWMASNIRTSHYADGTVIPLGGYFDSDTTPYYYVNQEVDEKKYGYYYNFPALLNGASPSNSIPSGVQGVAPYGWHVPSNSEFGQLKNYLSGRSEYILGGNTKNIAKSLASKENWKTSIVDYAVGNNQNENNLTLFSAQPAGFTWSGAGTDIGESATFYTCTKGGTNITFFIVNYNYAAILSGGSPNLQFGHSVRCVCDLSSNDFRQWYVNTYHTNEHIV